MSIFHKKDFKVKEVRMETVTIEQIDKKKLIEGMWKEVIEHSFITTGPNDGRPLSVIREDDIYNILSRRLDKGDKLEQY